MTRMVVGLVLLVFAGGCSRTPTQSAAPPPPETEPEPEPEPAGLYGKLESEPGARMRVFRAGVREPVAIVSLDEFVTIPLSAGVYVVVLEDGPRRVFAVSERPVRISGGIDDPWQGEDPIVQALALAQRRWFDWARADAEDSKTLRSRAHAEVLTNDPRLRRLEVLAAETVFAERDTPPSVAILDDLPVPSDPALAVIQDFGGAVYLAAKFGDDGAKQSAQAWLDATARTNPEPGARATALLYALDLARLADSVGGIAERYAWIPELDLEASAMLELIEASFAPDRLARPGAPLPAFTLVALDDPTRQIDRAALEGDLVLLHFWATWCRPCLEGIPELQRVHEVINGEDRHVHFVSINLDGDPALARAYVQEHPMPWTHLHGGTLEPDAVMRTFGLLGPSRLLVDRDRRIVATDESLHDTLEPTLREALDAAPGARSIRE